MWHRDWMGQIIGKMAPTALAQHRLATKLQLLKHALSMKQNKTKQNKICLFRYAMLLNFHIILFRCF